MSSIHRRGAAGMTVLLIGSTAALAGSVTIPNTFTAHTPAVASQVNANFGAVATAVNGNAADIAALQAAIASMQGQLAAQQVAIDSLNTTVASQQTAIDSLNTTVASQQATIGTLQSQMSAVQGSSVMALAANLDMIDVPDPNLAGVTYRTAQFRGINVRIVNGLGSTTTANGLGNLTVGYNEISPSARVFCLTMTPARHFAGLR